MLQLQPVFSAGLLQTHVTLSSSGVIQQTPTETYTYIISVSDSNYQMKDGITGQIVFQSTNSSQVFSNVVGNCSVGSSIDVESGVYAVNTMWTMIHVNNVTMNFENGAELVAGNGLDSSVLMLYESNNNLINGITINGNAANQVLVPSGAVFTSPNGITILGSNNKVDNALIFNCRQVGVEIWGTGVLGTAVHSGVVNSLIYDCGWNGITIGDVNDYVINNEIYGCGDVGVSTYGVSTLITGNYIHDMNGTTGFNNANWGIGVEGGDSHVITQNTIQDCSVGITNSGFNNCTISENTITNVGYVSVNPLWLGGGEYGISLSGKYNIVADNQVTGMHSNIPEYLGGIGIYLSSATFNLISGNIISQCGSGGIFLDGVSNNNTVSLNMAFDTLAGQYYDQVYGASGIEAKGSNNYISQNQCFDTRSGAARTQQYGIAMDPGAHNNILIGNNVHNNLNGQITDTNVPENIMINNTGYNPVGPIASPIAGNTAYLVDSGSNSTWISGMVYTNTGSPKVLNISGGTVSVVAQNGVTLFMATGCTVALQPGDTFSVTFSTAPSINVSGQ